MNRREIIAICLAVSACTETDRQPSPVGSSFSYYDAGLNLSDTADTGVLADAFDHSDGGVILDGSDNGFEDAASPKPDAGGQAPADTGVVNGTDAGNTNPPDPGPRVLNPGWIGGPCMSDADCSFTNGQCLTDGSGYPEGMCTQSCTQYCPDQAGALNSVTFCIEDGLQNTPGMCVSRCDYTLSPTGCRQGYVCLPEKRMNQASVVRDVCVPRAGLPNRTTPPFDIGEACVSASDCERNACIEGLPGGYCT